MIEIPRREVVTYHIGERGMCRLGPVREPTSDRENEKDRRESHRTIVLLTGLTHAAVAVTNRVRPGRETAKTAATSTADATTCRRSLFHLIPVRPARVRNLPTPWAERFPLDRACTINTVCKLAPVFPIRQQAAIFPEFGRDLWLPSWRSVLSTDACPGLWRDSRIACGIGPLTGICSGVFLAVGFGDHARIVRNPDRRVLRLAGVDRTCAQARLQDSLCQGGLARHPRQSDGRLSATDRRDFRPLADSPRMDRRRATGPA